MIAYLYKYSGGQVMGREYVTWLVILPCSYPVQLNLGNRWTVTGGTLWSANMIVSNSHKDYFYGDGLVKKISSINAIVFSF